VTHISLAERLRGKRVCVCAGPGGVGKTTTAAAIGLGLARRGARVVVLTIDPAKRLAGALGLEQLGGEPHLVDRTALAQADIQLPAGGELWALTLDVKGTFDALIAGLADDEGEREAVYANRIYQELSTAIAGSQEFTAVARLYELARDERFDVIVLDTPPSRNALDFVQAPARLGGFFDGRAVKVFLTPGGLAARLFGRGTGIVLSVFTRVTGVDLMGDISTFFRTLGSGIAESVSERASSIGALLRDPGTMFAIVTSPEPEPVRETMHLAGELDRADLHRGALIVNRVHTLGLHGHTVAEVQQLLAQELGSELARRVASNLADFDVLSERDRESVTALERTLEDRDPILVAHLHDVRDLRDLAEIERHLFA
jgi:anion-transporting  ArsA/GET3 family ATPase